VATLLLGVGVGGQAHADEGSVCKGKCAGGDTPPDASQGRAAPAVLSSPERSAFQLASQGAVEAQDAPAPAPATPDAQYQTAGLVSGEDLNQTAGLVSGEDLTGGGEAAELVSGQQLASNGGETSAVEAGAVTERRGALFARAMRVRTAYAAPLTASEDTCMGSRTFGVQVMGFGVSFATTWEDAQCRRLKNARELFALGYRAAAVQLLCMDDEVYAAMERAGTPCPSIRVTHAVAPAPPPSGSLSVPLPGPPLHVEPIPPPPLITFDDVLFDFDRWTLRSEAGRILDPLLQMMRANPNMRVNIEGHTDSVGPDAYNQALSERRAYAVIEWLVAHGVARDRLTAQGLGEGHPVATNQTVQGRQLNRRVEIHPL